MEIRLKLHRFINIRSPSGKEIQQPTYTIAEIDDFNFDEIFYTEDIYELKQIGVEVIRTVPEKSTPIYIIVDKSDLDKNNMLPTEAKTFEELSKKFAKMMETYIKECKKAGVK
jgi:hypothetical protein